MLEKPGLAFYRASLQLLGVDAPDTIMVGNGIRGDVDAARKAGMRAIVVRTGKFRTGDLEQGIAPGAVPDSLAALPQWWQQRAGG